jgi:hypothetical protein
MILLRIEKTSARAFVPAPAPYCSLQKSSMPAPIMILLRIEKTSARAFVPAPVLLAAKEQYGRANHDTAQN